MLYSTTIHNHTYQIQTDEPGAQRTITLDGTSHTIDWRQIAPLTVDAKGNSTAGGRYSLLISGHSYEVFARRITKAGQKDGEIYEIQVQGQRFEVKVEDERTRLLAGLAKTMAAGDATIQAPMPGLVIGIPLAQGTRVEQGQTVVVLEAMKMENDLPSPIAGTIREIRVSQGQTVDQGEVLVIVEA